MRIFLDANVVFSAAKSDGAISELMSLLKEGGHQCWVDAYVVEEARRNIARKAPGRSAILEHIVSGIFSTGTHAVDKKVEALLPLPPKDRPVLAAAIHLRCDVLVTGDRTHFGALYGKTLHGVTVHSPRSLAEALLR